MTTRPTKSDIHAELREQIILLDLPAGSRLREERLAAHFGVSRTPIRQVLDRLEFEGLVEQPPGAGARVTHLDNKEMRDVWAVRLKVTEMVGDFVRVPGPDVFERLKAIKTDLALAKKSKDPRALGATYNRFHEVMLEVLTNRPLARIHDLLYGQTARVWMQFLPELDLDTEVQFVREEIDQVIRVLRGGSGAEFARIRGEHMTALLERFNDLVGFKAPAMSSANKEAM